MRPRAREAILRIPDPGGPDVTERSEQDRRAGLLQGGLAGHFDALNAIVTPDYVVHPEEVPGPDGRAAMVKGYREAFTGLNVTIEHQFTEGDYVATRCTIRGRHDGELMGTPPSGRDVEFTSLTISRCRDGKIEEEWELVDTVSLLQQIGALPAAAPAAG